MNITLRKANALQATIQDSIKAIDIDLTVSINEFQTATTAVEQARDTLVQNDQRRTNLLAAYYAIRAAVGNANVQGGVSDLLARAAYVDKRIGQIKGLTESASSDSMEVIEGKLAKIRARKEPTNSYYHQDHDKVTTGVLSVEQINKYKVDLNALKKEKQTINDKMLELNIRTEIVLTDDIVQILQTEQIL